MRCCLFRPPRSMRSRAAELRQLRELLDKVVAADPALSSEENPRASVLKATGS